MTPVILVRKCGKTINRWKQNQNQMTKGANLYVNCNAQLATVYNYIKDDVEISNVFWSQFATTCSDA